VTTPVGEIGEAGDVDPRRLLPALAATAALCVVLTLVAAVWRGGEPPTVEEPPAVVPVATGPTAILARWDERRAAAWADGDADALRELYAEGSRAGAADVRLLRSYADRGLRVTGLRTQVLSLTVVDRGDRRLVLLVTDRIVGGRVDGAGEAVRLPADRASTRRISLVGAGEEWLVDEVRDQASAAASTSRTSSSTKS